MTSGDIQAQRRRGRRVAGWVAVVLACLVTLALLGAALVQAPALQAAE